MSAPNQQPQNGHQQAPPQQVRQPQQTAPQSPIRQTIPQGGYGAPAGPGMSPVGPGQPQIPHGLYQGPVGQVPNYAPALQPKRPVNGFAIAGLVVSLIATVVVLGRFSNLISPFGVVGLILSIIGYLVNRDEEQAGGSRTARIFSIVGAILSTLAIIITLLIGLFDPGFGNNSWLW